MVVSIVVRTEKFAVAYYREDLKAMDCNPDIFAQQNENKDNPHKTKHVDECMKALGIVVIIIVVMI